MKVILDEFYYVKGNEKRYFDRFECEIPDEITKDSEIIKYVTQKLEVYLSNEESK